MTGAEGAAGAAGAVGPTGPTGPTGATGATGAAPTPAAAVADVPTGSDIATLITSYNTLLANLRAAGLLAT